MQGSGTSGTFVVDQQSEHLFYQRDSTSGSKFIVHTEAEIVVTTVTVAQRLICKKSKNVLDIRKE